MATQARQGAAQSRAGGLHKQRESSSAAWQINSVAAQAGMQGLQSAVTNPQQASPAQLLEVQRLYGNRAVQRLLDGGAPENSLPLHAQNPHAISRASLPGSLEGGTLDPRSQAQIDNARGGGSPLDAKVGTQLGSTLGVDFSGVKVHTDPQADALNRKLSAKAFTTGSDIFFSQGAYQPGSAGGVQLLAHELTHVVQQGSAKPNKLQTKRALAAPDEERRAAKPNRVQFKLTVGAAHDRFEQEADRVAEHATAPAAERAASLTPAPRRGVVQRFIQGEGKMRYSAGRQIMLTNPKSLWVKDGPLTIANTVLDQKLSFVKLVKTGLSIESSFGGTLHEIKPAWNDARATTMSERERLKVANSTKAGYTTHADCFMTAQTVMGVEDTSLGSKTTASPIVDTEEEGRHAIAPKPLTESAGPGSAIATNSPTRSLQAFLDDAMPKFYDALKKEPQPPLAKDFLKDCTRSSTAGFMFAYRQLASLPKYAPLLDMFSRKFKVNEHVSPEIGEGLAVINDPIVRNKRQTEIQEGSKAAEDELWNYHFAGVVLKDGDEYVTLENYSVGDDKVDNQEWLFQLYGTGEQSFHGEMKGKRGVEGGAPLTLGFTKT